MKAAFHPQQAARLAALRAYDILDTPRESDFDEIVALASEVCGAPISVINLIDVDRQWFKAETGLGVRETPLDTSICSHAILENDYVEIADTLGDRRMQDNALCTGDPGLRFYAGALLTTKEGLPLGTLCVLDYKPRNLTPFQRQTMKTLARQVMSQLDLRLALKRETLLRKEIDHRVKNSLQTVSSLVGLQRLRSTDPALRSALEAVSQRIHTVALLHEELYQTSAVDSVDLSHYLPRLTGLIRGGAPDNLSIAITADSVTVDSRRASAVGVIVSEFVMNSIKHAFPGGRAGHVAIAVRANADGSAELLCSDDGVGLSPDPNDKPKGLGMQLIEASAHQVGGSIEKPASDGGFRLRVVLPADGSDDAGVYLPRLEPGAGARA